MSRPVLSPRLTTLLAVLVAAVAAWACARPLPEIQQQRRHFAELQRQVRLAEASKAARQADRGRVMRLQAQARMSQGAQRAQFEAEATAVQVRVGWGDASAVRAAVLATPMVPVVRTVVLEGFPDARPDAGRGCQACHIGIATPGLETFPAPFGTHPTFANYVGAASPHPPSRVGCASCHFGDEYASTFEGAGHARARQVPTDAPAALPMSGTNGRRWNTPDQSGAMLPAAQTEAGCLTCHLGERYQPGALSLNEALVTVERGGCYACHDVPGFDPDLKRGPDLRRIRGKLTPDWVRRWLANPAAVKPATWMPRLPLDPAAIDAVVAYLFEASEDYRPAITASPSGDATRGRQLVEAVGCLGCHVVGDAARDTVGVRRTFGQPLEAIGEKATQAWLVDWLLDPQRYSPDTRMPDLRLSTAEAVDIAAYLGTLTAPATPATVDTTVDDGQYRAVIERYAPPPVRATLDLNALSGSTLRSTAGRVVIGELGCANCHALAGGAHAKPRTRIPSQPVWSDGDLAVHGSAGGRATTDVDLHLGKAETSRLALALTAVAGRDTQNHALSTPWHLTKVAGRTLMQQRNCVGCHPVEDTGGDLVKLVAEPTLGPPLLTPEGARVQAPWLRGFLHAPTTVRPWLAVRMPTFHLSDDEVERVGNYLRAIAPENPKPTAAATGATAETGKALFDLLKCQQCHVLGSIPKDQPTSNLAPDLRMAGDRLQPDWVLAWLRNPGAILPGTRMPTFWPDYPASFYDPLDKDGQKQVRAIRDHVLNLR